MSLKKIIVWGLFVSILNGVYFYKQRIYLIDQAEKQLEQLNVDAKVLTLDLPFWFIFSDQYTINTVHTTENSYVPKSVSWRLTGNIIDGYVIHLSS